MNLLEDDEVGSDEVGSEVGDEVGSDEAGSEEGEMGEELVGG